MCGIAGFVGSGTTDDLSVMINTLKHRGPDYQGIYMRDKIGFAHARLSIIDLSEKGRQPMFSQDRSVVVVFNGEIYNFNDLRKELEKLGKYVFHSNSDTEVIIYAYKEYGEECFTKLNGMFAIALYDFSKEKLILARDRMGKKPLYWGIFNGNFIFASEPKAILEHPACRTELNLPALSQYLLYEYVPTPFSIFKNIRKLSPASYLVFDERGYSIKEFWKANFLTLNIPLNSAIIGLEERINKATQDRLVSDVPLGVFLSGGLDSSTIAYFAQKNFSKKIKTFSIGFTDTSFDESEYARRVADYLGTDHYEKKVSHSDVLSGIEDILSRLDEPFADQSLIPTHILSQFAREHVTVALSGDGGDELLAGYPTFQAEKIAQWYCRIPNGLRKRIIEPVILSLPVSHSYLSLEFKLKKFVQSLHEPKNYRHTNWLGAYDQESRNGLFNMDSLTILEKENPYSAVDSYVSQKINADFYSLLLYIYQRTYMMDGVLVKVDRASMMNSLEVRSPLLDTDVVEFVNSLPFDMKLRGLTTKFILKKMMSGRIPSSIIHREKKGFGIPMGQWLKGELRPWCDSILSKRNIDDTGLFNFSYVDTLKREHYSGSKNNTKKIWSLIVFIIWYKNFIYD